MFIMVFMFLLFPISTVLILPWLTLLLCKMSHLSDVCKITVPEPVLRTAKLKMVCLSPSFDGICSACVLVHLFVSCKRIKSGVYL